MYMADDTWTLNKGRVFEFCELLRKHVFKVDPNLLWRAHSRGDTLKDTDICQSMVSANMEGVDIGVESGSQHVLDMCNKRLLAQDQLDGIKTASRYKLNTKGLFIVGLMGETNETIEETKRFIHESNIDCARFGLATVLPNTELYYHAKKHGLQDLEYIEKGAPIFTCENKLATLNRWQRELIEVSPSCGPMNNQFWGHRKYKLFS